MPLGLQTCIKPESRIGRVDGPGAALRPVQGPFMRPALPRGMLGLTSLAIAVCISAMLIPSRADDLHRACLSPDQRREAVANRKVIPLSRAVRTLKARGAGEVVRAQLCEQGKGLVYVLTVLSRDGKVTHTTVDAMSGNPLGGG